MDLKKKLPKSRKIAIILIVFGAIFSFAVGPIIISLGFINYQNTLNAKEGLLKSTTNTMTQFNVFLGNNEGIYDSKALAQGIDLTKIIRLSFNKTTISYPLQISFDNAGRLLVSAKILNAQGDKVAEIYNNNWQSFGSSWDKNYNDYAFEATEDIGNTTNPQVVPVLQVILANQNTIFIGFYLNSSIGQIFLTIDHGLQINPALSEIKQIESSTIFKHPSSIYPNELKNTSFTLRQEVYDSNTNSYVNQTLTINYPTSSQLSQAIWVIVEGATLTTIGGLSFAFGFEILKINRTNERDKRKNHDANSENQSFKQRGQGNSYYRHGRKNKGKGSRK